MTLTITRLIAAVLLLIAAFCVASLVRGGALLEAILPGGLPLGNALTALGLCAAAGAAYTLSAHRTMLRSASLSALVAAALWLPVSIALAGNLSLNFGGGRGLTWMIFSLAVVAGALGTLFWALSASLLAIRRRTGATGHRHSEGCVFCAIARRETEACIVYEDALTIAFVDLRQFHPGHMLVIPRTHCADIRGLDAASGAALMESVVRITRAVADAFPNEGLSLWHSIGPAAFQEVPHLHIHVHPRRTGDGLLRVYPGEIPTADAESRQAYARMVRVAL